jgi:hypothetical protein
VTIKREAALVILLSQIQDVTAKSRHPLEKGDPCLFNYLIRMDFAPLPDMARLRGNDNQDQSRLFAVTSSMPLRVTKSFRRT